MPPRVGYTGPAPHNLHAWRKHQQITLARLAEAIGTTKGHLSNIENGRTSLTPELGSLIAKHLGITLETLRGRVPEEGPDLESDLLSLFRGASPSVQKVIVASARAIAELGRAKD